uniref:PDZ domain-containing protein n=1 Tax=Wuchereria bancrofti TaxID=6293 RepID=A0AAF5PQF8_WUCBA
MFHTMSTTTDNATIASTGIVHCQQNANYVTILAIYDEPGFAVMDSTSTNASQFATNGTMSSSTTAKTAASAESPLDGKLNIISSSSDGDIVEITNIAIPPTDGLRVISDNAHTLQQKPSSSAVITGPESISPQHLPSTQFDQKHNDISNTCRVYHSALKNVGGSPRSKYRVTISPDVDCQSSQESPTLTKESPMTRTSARKSRLTDNFFDAKERLEEKLAGGINSCVVKGDMKSPKLIPLMEAASRGQTVIILSDTTINMKLGIEISPVYDPSNDMRLQAVEIRQIDDESRVGSDGRLRIGDRIVEINQRPVYQMSISRAHAYLHEIQAVAHPSLTIDRSIETFASDTISHRSQSSTSSLQKRPILSALQQANTTALGITFPVEIVKRSGGFGFTVTSRETAKGERLFYIGTVKADGAAVNKLRAGDRLLQINGKKTAELTQSDMVERLKKLDVGDSINLLISRIGSQENEKQNPLVVTNNYSSDSEHCHQERATEGTERYGEEILTLKIALNETGSAGLGVSLKARAIMKPDGTRHDCGIFIKKVLHGGAAYKDGRLRLNDQLIGIEDIDLRRMTRNSEASDAITRCLKNIGPNANDVCLRVARKVELNRNNAFPSVRSSTDESWTPNCESSKIYDRSQAKSEDDDDNTTAKKQETPNGYNADVPRFSSSDERSLNVNGDFDSTASDRQKCISEDEMNRIGDSGFSRENPARRSISEKRHMGVGMDANSTMLFQKIKHNRQMSAPLLHRFVPFISPTHKSLAMFSSRSAVSLREKCRRRSLASLQSSEEKTVTGRSIEKREKCIPISASYVSNTNNESTNVASSSSSPNRRSLSLESMETHRSPPLAIVSAHPNGSAIRDTRIEQTARRGHLSTLKRSQKSRCNGYIKPSISDAEDQTSTGKGRDEPYTSLPREISATSKEKQQRRKSVGGSIFSKITQRFGGSRSRDTSPEKVLSFDVIESNSFRDKANRTQDHREWSKESRSNQSIRKAPPPYKPSSYDILQSSDSNYYVNDVLGTHKTETVCSGKELPAGGYIRVANSKFYNSFVEREKVCWIGEDNIRQQFATANTIAEKEGTHPSIAKQEMDVVMSYMCNSANSRNNSGSNMQTIRSVVMKDDASSSNNVWPITRDAAPTTTMPSTLGLRTVQLPHAEIYLSLQEEEVDIHPSTLTFPQQQKQCHRTEQQYNKFTIKDSDHVQFSFPHQECERSKVSKGLVPTTQPAMTSIPAVFPTSRNFFFAPSTRMSGHRINDSGARAPSSLRNRAQSVSTRPPKECALAESRNSLKSQTSMFTHKHSYQNKQQHSTRNSSTREPVLLCSYQSQEKQSPGFPDSFIRSPSHLSAPHLPYAFDEATFSSPTYLQTLLESPTRICKDASVINVPKPVKYIKIHYGPSYPSPPKQQPLRARTMTVRSPNSDSLQKSQQQTTSGFDYQRYLRSTRRNRINDQKQRITLIAAVPDETMFMRGTTICRVPRPNTIYNATSSS